MRFARLEINSEIISAYENFDQDVDQQIASSGGAPNEQRWIRVPDDADERFLMVLTDENGLKYIEEDEDAKEEFLMASLRAERNVRLQATDFKYRRDIQATMTQEEKDALDAYCQELRDLPENTLDPANPVWPEEP